MGGGEAGEERGGGEKRRNGGEGNEKRTLKKNVGENRSANRIG